MLDATSVENVAREMLDMTKRYAQRKEKQLDCFIRSHRDLHSKLAEQIRGIRETIELMQREGEETRKRMQGFEAERQELLRMLEKNVVDVKTVEEKVKYLSEQIETTRMNYRARQTGWSDRERQFQLRINDLKTRLQVYVSALAVTFARNGQSIEISFRQISETRPDQPYTVVISLGGNNSYSVTDCRPPLDEIRELERRLQETNDLKGFVCAVRKKFVSLATH